MTAFNIPDENELKVFANRLNYHLNMNDLTSNLTRSARILCAFSYLCRENKCVCCLKIPIDLLLSATCIDRIFSLILMSFELAMIKKMSAICTWNGSSSTKYAGFVQNIAN